jgi:NAD(P)-dependent dehydrogenase (short-subunit alcohol dehydrogenase family)
MICDDPGVAVVTGANRGIGRAVASQLAERGHLTVLGSRDPERGENAAHELAAEGTEVVAHQLDVTDQRSVDRLTTYVERELGRLDVLVNNAGILYDTWQRATEADLEVVKEAIETNLLGAWRMSLAAIPLIEAGGRGGRIVNVSSASGSLAEMRGGTPAYGVSKAALNALTRKLADELQGTGILVNSVCPGWVATDMTSGAGSRSTAEGAASVLWAVEIPDDGPSGGFFRDGRPVSW